MATSAEDQKLPLTGEGDYYLNGLRRDKLFPDKSIVFRILVCGRTGVGKSTLIDSMFGKHYCTSELTESQNFLNDYSTTEVKRTVLEINGIAVEIFDSPGLRQLSRNQTKDQDQVYLDNMHKYCKNVDLVLYCIEMGTRFSNDDEKTVELITSKFGEEFWQKSVLVQTKANIVKSFARDVKEFGSERDHHKAKYLQLKKEFDDILRAQKVHDEIIKAIPAVAVGLRSPLEEGDEAESVDEDQFIWYVSSKTEECDGRIDFLPELLMTCFERVSRKNRRDFMESVTPRKKVEQDRQLHEKLRQEIENRDKKMEELVQAVLKLLAKLKKSSLQKKLDQTFKEECSVVEKVTKCTAQIMELCGK